TVNIVDHRQVLEGGQIVAAADEEDGGVVQIEPRLQGRLAMHLGGAQGVYQQQGSAGFSAAYVGIVGFEAEGHTAVPHHALKVSGQLFADGVVAARDVLGVIFAKLQAREKRRGQDARSGFNVGQLRSHQLLSVSGHGNGGVQQLAAHTDEGDG